MIRFRRTKPLPGQRAQPRVGRASRRVLAVLAAALSWTASATPAAADAITLATIDTPAGWVDAPEQAPAVVLAVNGNRELAAFRGATVARAWQSSPAGAVLFLSWAETTGAVDDATDTARRVLTWVRGMPDAAALEPGDAAVVSWTQGETRGAVDARLEWEHRSYGTRTMSRLLIYRRAGRPAGQPARVGFAHAECLRRADAPAALADGCRAALDSLALTTPEAERTALTGVTLAADQPGDAADPDADAPADPGAAAGADDGAESSAPGTSPAIGTTGEAPVLYAGQGNEEEESSWIEERWLLIVGALLLLIAFYFTTRGKEEDDEAKDDEVEDEENEEEDDADEEDDEASDDADDDDADDDDADDDDADDDGEDDDGDDDVRKPDEENK